MRLAGLTLLALLVGVATTWAQPPASPGAVPKVPGSPPPLPAAVAPADQKLDAHLAGWERTMTALNNFRFELELKRNDPAATGVFKKDRVYTGEVLCMKPNLARLRLVDKADPKDYEAFICDGKAVYAYSGSQKTITEHKLPDPKANPAGATDNLMLDIMTGMKAADVKRRFDIQVFKEDEHYVYLDIKPILGKDKEEFKQLRLALYGPKTKFAYLPAQVFMIKKNNETEQWMIGNPMTNIAAVEAKHFQYEDVPGFRTQKAPQQPAARPGMPTPPTATPRR